ncbi:MAG: hypothetical protein H0W08_16230 [Acidobacteria bacterium]|nr:hypothetical protein [Acidobacteriota bacterium]
MTKMTTGRPLLSTPLGKASGKGRTCRFAAVPTLSCGSFSGAHDEVTVKKATSSEIVKSQAVLGCEMTASRSIKRSNARPAATGFRLGQLGSPIERHKG